MVLLCKNFTQLKSQKLRWLIASFCRVLTMLFDPNQFIPPKKAENRHKEAFKEKYCDLIIRYIARASKVSSPCCHILIFICPCFSGSRWNSFFPLNPPQTYLSCDRQYSLSAFHAVLCCMSGIWHTANAKIKPVSTPPSPKWHQCYRVAQRKVHALCVCKAESVNRHAVKKGHVVLSMTNILITLHKVSLSCSILMPNRGLRWGLFMRCLTPSLPF